MTRSEVHDLFGYNSWAHRRLFDIIATLPHEQYMRHSGSSHGSMHGTLTHAVGAEEIWLGRWTGAAPSGLRKPEEFPDFPSLRNHWETIDLKLKTFVANLKSEESIKADITYHDLKGNKHTQPLGQLIQHLVNHSSYHRGQLVMFLRQYGLTPVSTDMVAYFREKQILS